MSLGKSKGRKAQAAMEFLMTHGWAALVILLALAALVYIGGFRPERFLTDICSLQAGISCNDFIVGSSSISVLLQNNWGNRITITNVEIKQNGVLLCSNTDALVLQHKDQSLITVDGCASGNAGAKFKAELEVTYALDTGVTHLLRGDIIAKVSPSASLTSLATCQNAQDDDLCGGLDLVYGAGYQAGCCTEHVLCC